LLAWRFEISCFSFRRIFSTTIIATVFSQAIFVNESSAVIHRIAARTIVVNVKNKTIPFFTSVEYVVVAALLFIFFHCEITRVIVPTLLLCWS